MEFYDIAGHPVVYAMVISGILLVLSFIAISFKLSWARAIEKGYTKKQLYDVIKASAIFSIVPSISIVIGFFGLAALLGIAWSWWRLSVAGSVAYELMATDMALKSSNLDLLSASGTEFVLIMFVMTIGILGGPIVSLFISKKIQENTTKRASSDARWGALSNSIFMPTIAIVFIIPMIVSAGVTLLTLLSSVVICILLTLIMKKTGAIWLNNFILSFSMIGAMVCSVLWTGLLQ